MLTNVDDEPDLISHENATRFSGSGHSSGRRHALESTFNDERSVMKCYK